MRKNETITSKMNNLTKLEANNCKIVLKNLTPLSQNSFWTLRESISTLNGVIRFV